MLVDFGESVAVWEFMPGELFIKVDVATRVDFFTVVVRIDVLICKGVDGLSAVIVSVVVRVDAVALVNVPGKDVLVLEV